MYDGFEDITLDEVIQKPNMMNKKFISQLSQSIKADEHEAQKEDNQQILIDLYGDPKMLFARFESNFYEAKLTFIYNNNNNFLLKCKHCNQLFTCWKIKQDKYLKCPKSINNDEQHEIDTSFNVNKFITYIRSKYKISWREIYWKVWSFLNVFKCESC